MFARLCRLIWLLLCTLCSAYEILHWFCVRLQATVLWSYDLYRHRQLRARGDHSLLEQCKLHVSKLPRHLNVIVGPSEKHIREQELTRIFDYALTIGIDYISIYDTRLADSGRVSLDQLCAPKAVSFKQLHSHHYLWSRHATAHTTTTNGLGKINAFSNGSSNGTANGLKTRLKSVEILELNESQCRPLIADVCRELFDRRHEPEIQLLLKDRTLLMQRINEELLTALHAFPDPELCIIFNQHLCMYGLLPWQARFTEFHRIDSGHNFNAHTFTEVLYRYARCHQRWGK